MKTRKIIIVALCLLVCFLTGCSSYVSVYTTQVSVDTYTVAVDVFASIDDLKKIENNGAKLENYLTALADECGVTDEGSTLSVDKDGNGNLYATFVLNVDESDIKRDEVTTKRTQGFLLDTYTIRFKNPLDRFKNAYNDGINEKPKKGTDLYLVWVILYGEGNLKSFSEYFSVDKSIASDLSLNFLLKTRMLYTSNAKTEYVLTKKYFKWTTKVSASDGYIEYTVKSVNSWAWYVLAIALGVGVTVTLYLISKKSKKKPSLKDESVLERTRAMNKNVPKNARVEPPPPSKVSDSEIFDENEKSQNEEKD